MFDRILNFYKAVRLAYNTGYTEPQTALMQSPTKKSLLNRLQYAYVWRISAEVDVWRKAIEAAESPYRPDRRALYSIYRETELNSEVATQLRVATYTVCRSPFQISKTGKPDEKVKELFERSWFDDFLKTCVENEMFGHTLIEFDPFRINNEFRYIYTVPRDHVRPEFGDVLLASSDYQGVDYRDKKQFPFLVEIGRPWDFGLYRVVSLPAIRMKYSDSDWSLFSEKFGMPIIAVKTTTRDKNELDEKERMASNLGTNGYVILDDQDDISFMSAQGGQSPHGVYLDRIKLAENQIAKLINGQASTSDEKSHVGSAEVHERILNNFTFARLRNIQFIINETLLPFLTMHGYALDGYKFQFTELLQTSKEPNDDNPNDKNQNKQKELDNNAPVKKNGRGEPLRSPNLRSPIKQRNITVLPVTSQHDRIAQYYQQDTCCTEHATRKALSVKMRLDLTALMERVVSDIYTERIKQGDLNIELWKQNADAIIKGMEKGYGKSFLKTEYSDPDYKFILELRQNIFAFAAFKNHHNMNDMFAAMRDDNGNLRPFSEFKKIATKLNNTYNVNWLNAEYQTALGTARMAANWHHTIAEHGEDVLLRFNTVGDSRVRNAHKKLDGVTLPASDKFWKTYYPPVGWNCRCDVDVVFDEPTQDLDEAPSDKEVPPSFRFNAGIEGKIFSGEHPYFNIDKKTKETMRDQYNKFLEELPYDPPKTFDNGSTIEIHPTHNAIELEENLWFAEQLAVFQKNEIKLKSYIDNVEGRKNPDAEINGIIADFKMPKKTGNIKNAIQSHVEEVSKQLYEIEENGIAVIAIDNPTATRKKISDGLYYALMENRNKNINEVWLVFPEEKDVIKISRSEVKDLSYKKKLL